MYWSRLFPTSFLELVVTVITHFSHAIFHVFQRVSVPWAAPTNNLCQTELIQHKLQETQSRNPGSVLVPNSHGGTAELCALRTLRDSLFRSRGSGASEEWGWNLRCSSCTSSLGRPEQVWELSLRGTDTDALWPGMTTKKENILYNGEEADGNGLQKQNDYEVTTK